MCKITRNLHGLSQGEYQKQQEAAVKSDRFQDENMTWQKSSYPGILSYPNIKIVRNMFPII